MWPLNREPSSLTVMESSSTDQGGHVTNHPPSRPAGQTNPPRHQDRARDHNIVAVRIAHYMPSAGPRSRIFGPAATQNKVCSFFTSCGVKGWGKEAKRNRARDISVVAVRTANRTSKYRGANQRDFEEQARTANKHQEEPSEYRKDWNGVRASKGARAWSRVQRVLKAPSPERYQWSPKGCARYGISTGHRGAPER